MGMSRQSSGRQGRSRRNTMAIFGIILLVTLLLLISPNILPNFLSNTFNFIDDGIPCSRLPVADNMSIHQSLIGRQTTNPLSLRVLPDPLPQTRNDEFSVRVSVVNNSVGSIPIVYAEDLVMVGDNGSNGLGIVFDPQIVQNVPRARPIGDPQESDIRILGPRQRCVHRFVFLGSEVNAQRNAVNTVQAYYRLDLNGIANNISGLAPVFADKGLQVATSGLTQSDVVTIPPPQAVNQETDQQ